MLHHADIWRAIDRLAERHGLSPSGLARKAGLSATLFNPSKRINGKRKRWPSTESIAAILKATGSSLDEFVALASPDALQHNKLPLLDSASLGGPSLFDEAGRPIGNAWDESNLPGAQDPHAFIVELTNASFAPAYNEGTKIILSPAEKLRRGDKVGVCTSQGEFFIKILGREGAQKIELLPLNPSAGDPPLTLPRNSLAFMHRIVWVSQ